VPGRRRPTSRVRRRQAPTFPSVRVTRVGDMDFLVDEQVDRFRFIEENEKVVNRGGEPADRTPGLPAIGWLRCVMITASPFWM